MIGRIKQLCAVVLAVIKLVLMDADSDVILVFVEQRGAVLKVGYLLLSQRFGVVGTDGGILRTDLLDLAAVQPQDIRRLARDRQVDIFFEHSVI